MKRFVITIFYLLSMHLIALAILLLLRLALLASSWGMLMDSSRTFHTLLTSLMRGAWIDNTVLSYMSALPVVIFLLLFYARCLRGGYFKCMAVYYSLFHPLAFMATVANIPYVKEFGALMNMSAISWVTNERNVVHMILRDTEMLFCLVLAIALWAGYAFAAYKMAQWAASVYHRMSDNRQILLTVPLSLLLVFVCFMGIRGWSFAGRPITVYPAYFCKDKAVTTATLNPLLHLILSLDETEFYGDRKIVFYEKDELDCYAMAFWGRKAADRPLLHKVAGNDSALYAGSRPNVVLVLMEGISYYYTNAGNGGKNLMPFLDSLSKESLHFTNCYSSGYRTNNGITGAVYSFPAYLERHCMRNLPASATTGIPYELGKRGGYHTLFFATHEGDFDNTSPFLTNRHFQLFYGMEDYPPEKKATPWGCTDDFLFSFAIDKLNRESETGSPFFATLLTITNHTPYIFPKGFKPKSNRADDQILEVADWHLRNFFEKAKQQSWFDNTVFVFVADHGHTVTDANSLTQDPINHIPLLFYGKNIPAAEYDGVTSQLDIGPILFGMLGHEYDYEHLGVDVLKTPRQYVTYTTLDMIKCRSKDRCFCYDVKNDLRYYYRLQDNVATETVCDEEFTRMEHFCLSSFQLMDEVIFR